MANRFIPIRGRDSDIRQIPVTDGYVYFAYDTGIIYLDKNEERHVLGGSVGGTSFMWANAEEDINLFKDDESSAIDPNYTMLVTAIEGSTEEDPKYPQNGIMIINSDGRFFRVKNSNAANGEIYLSLIAVSGSGSGGSSSSRTLQLIADGNTIANGNVYVANKTQYITVTGSAINGNPDSQVTLTFTFTDNQHNGIVYDYSRTATSGIPYNFDTSVLKESTDYTLVVGISSTNSGMKPKDTPILEFERIKIVNMTISKPLSTTFVPIQRIGATNKLTLSYLPKGDGLTAQLHVVVNGTELSDMAIIRPTEMGQTKTVAIPDQPHGVWDVSMWLSSTTNTGAILESDPIIYQCAWYDNNEEAPIIWTGDYATTVDNYDSVVIPFMIYDPNAIDSNSEVRFYQNGALLDYSMSIRYQNTGWYNWDITSLYELGENNFAISLTSGSNSTSLQINFTVVQGERNMDLRHKDALLLNFSSVGRSNSESATKRNIWQSSVGNYSAQFTNFNWFNNGWKNDNDGNGSYLSVANGSSVTIPFINIPFNNVSSDYSIELRFRVRNIQEYSTLVTIDPHYFCATGSEIPTVNFVMDPADPSKKYSASAAEIKAGVFSAEGLENTAVKVAVDKDGNWIMDQSNSPKLVKTSAEDGVVFKLMDGSNGLCVGTQEAYFKAPSGVSSVRYKEDEIINLTLVVSNKLAFLYLNGVLSGATSLATANTFQLATRNFEINSDTCDFDLYRLRVYNWGLTMPDVIANYIADIHDVNLYDENQLTRDGEDTALSYMKILNYNQKCIENHEIDKLTMPYATIEIIDSRNGLKTPTGGTAASDKIDYLPYFKGNNRYAKITFVNPMLDAAYENGTLPGLTQEAKDNYYLHHCPSFVAIGVNINVQGTSSQGYPRRNFKTTYKSAVKQEDYDENIHEDWGWFYTGGPLAGERFEKFYMDNDTYGVNKFTWKIDYMESSESYNTGFANMASTMYSKHPLDDYNINGLNTRGLRTSVYGFPVLTFHKHATAADNAKIGTDLEDQIYEYLGKYNMNLDKSANEAYGFELKVKNPVLNQNIKDIAECWELTDNQGTWTSFNIPADPNNREFFDIRQSDDDNKLEVLNHFEYRYTSEDDKFDAAADYDLTQYDDLDTYGKVNTWLKNKFANLEVLFRWLDSTNTTKATNADLDEPITWDIPSRSDADVGHENDVVEDENNNLFYTFTKDTAKYRLQKFRKEFNKHLDREYCEIYFVLSELCICYDSRGKNMMLASFGPQEVDGDYIWYPIYYDVDTQLGLNNIGATLWDYDTDATLEETFSTPHSVLWDNFYAVFGDAIKSRYASLRSNSKLTYDTVEGAYTCDPNVFDSYAMKGIRPIIAVGLDEYVKYIAPTISGYINTLGETKYDANYYYAINGDRKLSRELFLRNRFNYMDSYWMAGSYSSTQVQQASVRFRISGNSNDTSDTYLDSVSLNGELPPGTPSRFSLAVYPKPYLDAVPQFTLTPFLSQYVFTYYDSVPSGRSVKYQGLPVETIVSDAVIQGYKTNSALDEQIVYIPGVDYLSSMGDLSIKYPSQLTMSGGKRLLDLKIGSDIPGYYNGKLGVGEGQFDINASATKANGTPNPDKKALLKSVILTNVTNLSSSLDLSGSEKLIEFRDLGTQIPMVTFAEGAPLETVHLAASTNTLELIESRNLTRILTSRPVICRTKTAEELELDDSSEYIFTNKAFYKGLYIENVTDAEKIYPQTYGIEENVSTNLNKIHIEGGALGYDSYTLLAKLVAIKEKQGGEPPRLHIDMQDVKWSPYELIDDNDYSDQITYYYLTDHNTFEQYTYVNANQWNIDTLNNRIFTYDSTKPYSRIQNLDLLDKFIDEYELAVAGNRLSRYANNAADAIEATYPAISGTIYVDNEDTVASRIKESDIGDKYKTAFPNLNIYAHYVTESFVSRYVNRENDIDTLIDIKRQEKGENVHPQITQMTAARTNYDFVGWALDPEGQNMVAVPVVSGNSVTIVPNETFNNLVFSNETTSYTFYAIFEKHNFIMSFNFNNGDEIITVPTQWSTSPGINEPNTIPYKEYPVADNEFNANYQLGLYRKYKFMGWAKTNAPNTVVNLNNIIPNRDYSFIAVYDDVSVYDDVLPQKYLTYNYDYSTNKYRISLNQDYYLVGKITLPTTLVINDTIVPIKQIANNGFIGANNNRTIKYHAITHIFWDTENRALESIGQEAFLFCSDLVYFEMPETCHTLSRQSFNGCSSLCQNDDEFGSMCKEMLDPITYYSGDHIFAGCSNLNTLVLSGDKELSINSNAFSNMFLSKIIIGSSSHSCNWINSSNISIGSQLFSNRSTYLDGISCDCYLYIEDPSDSTWDTLIENKFGFDNLVTVTKLNADTQVNNEGEGE